MESSSVEPDVRIEVVIIFKRNPMESSSVEPIKRCVTELIFK